MSDRGSQRPGRYPSTISHLVTPPVLNIPEAPPQRNPEAAQGPARTARRLGSLVVGRQLIEQDFSVQIQQFYEQRPNIDYARRTRPAIIYLNSGQLAEAHLTQDSFPDFWEAMEEENATVAKGMLQDVELRTKGLKFQRSQGGLVHVALRLDTAGSHLTEERRLARLVTSGNELSGTSRAPTVVLGGARMGERFLPKPGGEAVEMPEVVAFGPVELFAIESVAKQFK